jgi:hypothetical protein
MRSAIDDPREGDVLRQRDGDLVIIVDRVVEHSIYYRVVMPDGALRGAYQRPIEGWRELAGEQCVCPTCQDETEVTTTCPRCEGIGEVDWGCWSCAGTGLPTSGPIDRGHCSTCGGDASGWMICPDCDGDRVVVVDCPDCALGGVE